MLLPFSQKVIQIPLTQTSGKIEDKKHSCPQVHGSHSPSTLSFSSQSPAASACSRATSSPMDNTQLNNIFGRYDAEDEDSLNFLNHIPDQGGHLKRLKRLPEDSPSPPGFSRSNGRWFDPLKGMKMLFFILHRNARYCSSWLSSCY